MCPALELPPLPPFPERRDLTGPHCWVEVKLRDEGAIEASETDSAYAAGLRVLAGTGDRSSYQALESLRDTLTQSDGSTRTSAALMVGLLSVAFGDSRPLETLHDYILEEDGPDPFAARHVATCSLNVSPGFDPYLLDPIFCALSVSSFIERPSIAYQVGLTGSLLMHGQLQVAAETLETIVEPAETSWRAACETFKAGGDWQWLQSQFRVLGIETLLCHIYRDLDDPDAVLDVVQRFPDCDLTLQKAEALERKGLPDAAVFVYSNYIEALAQTLQNDDIDATMRINWARYAKARLLIADGRLRPAREEIARLYADSPNFPDSRGLREKLAMPRLNVNRAAISEATRHAVWRRDQGRCVQCGSQERLEFDHIIPLSRGGANTERNLQLLCEQCNRQKGATI